ncbi:hypothetical protein BGZ46_001635 [Entomortierella lignicola]|nr:hypothetical protein BGZ46_001635 [Entomortierella lignicola]
MSHDENRDPKGLKTGSRASQKATVNGGQDNVIPSRASTHKRRNEVIFRHQRLHVGINFHVRTACLNSLIITIPDKRTDPLDVIDLIFEELGPVSGFHQTKTWAALRMDIVPADEATYEAMKRKGLTFNGQHLRAIVPTHVTFKVIKVNYRNAPAHLGIDDFHKIFKNYGTVVEISRQYHFINRCKVILGEGFVFVDRTDMNEDLPLPSKPIDLGREYIQTRNTMAPVPSHTRTRQPNPTIASQLEPNSGSLSSLDRRVIIGNKRDWKGRNKFNTGGILS